jgi:hypothetical protein
MKDVFVTICENILDTLVVGYLILLCIILLLIGFLIYFYKPSRKFIWRQINKLATTADHFLMDCQDY